jgi:competence protein ComEC
VRCPAAIPAIALCAGISAGIFFSPPIHPIALLSVFLAATAAFAVRRERWTTTLIIIGFVLAGVERGRVADLAARNSTLRGAFERQVPAGVHQVFTRVEGTLRTDVVKGPAGATLDVLIQATDLSGTMADESGGALIGVGGEPTSERILHWRAGRRVAFPATLRRPTRYFDPGVPDADRQLAWRGVALVGSVKSDRLVDVIAPGTPLAEARSAARRAIREAIASSVAPWSDRSAAVVSAILIGDRTGLDATVERRLQEAGTYHVIAISGGNIAILAALCVFFLRVLRSGPRSSAVLVIIMLAGYASLVEGGSSVGRATLMAAIYFAAQLWDHRTPPLNAAALTAAVLLYVDPLQAVDAGFALTFGATIGILVGMSKLIEHFPVSPSLRAPAALLAASACADVALLPIGALVFSRVTFAGLAINFAAIPLMAIVQVAGMTAVALTSLSATLAESSGWIAHLAVEGLIRSAALVDVFPWLTWRVAPPPLPVVAVYYIGLISIASGRFIRASTVAFAAAAMWVVCAPLFPTRSDSPLRVTFLDVGQGDAAIVQFPDGRTLAVDTGGSASLAFDIGARVVAPASWALGVRRIDYMSVTHGDLDHIGGALSLFRDFRPFEVWEGVPVPPHAPTRELRAFAGRAGSVWRTLQRGDRAHFGAVEVIVHHPPPPEWERQRVRNDDSEVLEIRYGGVSIVFTGDIGREVEQAIAPSFARASIRIMKVPHHGSATSSSQLFLDALRPDIAVFSAGRGNPFGHPVASVLDRYRRAGAAMYRTDQDGAVSVETDGTTVRVTTFLGRRLTLTTKGRE